MLPKTLALLISSCFSILVPALNAQMSTALPTTSPHAEADIQALPRFEVATIKPARQDNYKPIGLYVYPGGRIQAGQSTLKMLVQFAFNVKDFQILGGPHWIDEDMYEVQALPPNSSMSRQLNPKMINMPPSDEQREMLQSLLIERFGLKFHRDVKEGPAYLLVRSNKSLKLEEAKHKDYSPWMSVGGRGNGGMTGQGVSMPFMASRLSTYLERPVLDQTGLNGFFDFKLDSTPEDSVQESNEDFLSGIFRSMEQLGLTLKPGKAPMEILFIDSAAKPVTN